MEHLDNRLALGIDLGGTNLRTGFVTASGQLLDFQLEAVDRSLSAEAIVKHIAQQVRGAVHFDRSIGAGLALPGAVTPDGVPIPGLVNLPQLDGFPIGQRLAEVLGKPCRVGNDANLALLGEATFGAAQGCGNVLLLTLGTAIGSGLLIGGQLHQGSHSSAAELGLTLIRTPEGGGFVTIESRAAPGAVSARYGDPDVDLFAQASAGDEHARRLLDEMFEHLGVLITNTHLLLDLELVLLSGGMAAAGEPLRAGVEAAVRRVCPPGYFFDLAVKLGQLPAHASGVFGAASLWFSPSP